MEEKFIYVVYGLDYDEYDSMSYLIAKPTKMEVFDSREKAIKFFKDTCIKIAKEWCDGAFAGIPEEELFNDVTRSNIDENLSIEFWENDDKAEWYVCVGNSDELDDDEMEELLEDYSTIYPRMFMKKIKVN